MQHVFMMLLERGSHVEVMPATAQRPYGQHKRSSALFSRCLSGAMLRLLRPAGLPPTEHALSRSHRSVCQSPSHATMARQHSYSDATVLQRLSVDCPCFELTVTLIKRPKALLRGGLWGWGLVLLLNPAVSGFQLRGLIV